MITFVPLADGALAELLFLYDGVPLSCGLWFVSRQPPVDSTQVGALAAGVEAWAVDHLMPELGNDLLLDSVRATDWTVDPAPSIAVVPALVSGGAAERSLSASVAIRVVFKGSSDQTFKDGSNFVPGVPLSATAGNAYTLELRDAVFEAYVALIDLAPVFGPFPAWRWVVTSGIINGAPRSTRAFARTDFVLFPSPFVSPRRRRVPD